MNKIAVIPVRSGSKRLPKKNYIPFNSRTIVEIARDKCLMLIYLIKLSIGRYPF